MAWPDRISVYHKLRSLPTSSTNSFILDVIIISERHQRPAARCVEYVCSESCFLLSPRFEPPDMFREYIERLSYFLALDTSWSFILHITKPCWRQNYLQGHSCLWLSNRQKDTTQGLYARKVPGHMGGARRDKKKEWEQGEMPAREGGKFREGKLG